jgi:hypothetical protein
VASIQSSHVTGYARFPFAGGGLCPGDSILVEVSDLILGYVTRVASLDQNGDLRVDSTDVALVQSKVGTADPTADFDGDGQVTAADMAIVREHVGHAAPDAVTAVPLPGSSTLGVSPPRPNPFSNETRFTLALDRNASVDVSVYDLRGRRVASVFQGELGAGGHALAWPGRSADGSAAPNGIYFIRVQIGRERLVRRVILLGGN